jgi:chaperonin GroEL (HSP60 family)
MPEKAKSINNLKKEFSENFHIEEEKQEENINVILKSANNVVSGAKLRKIQSETLASTKDFLSNTFGPMGSNTKIISGNNRESISSTYSKDGLKVLQNIVQSAPIEASIVEELIDITKHVEHEVGDGTTSTVILSSLIFDKLMLIQEKFNVPPYKLVKAFENVVSIIKDKILENKKECTLDDIYDICMISTNSNKEVSEQIKSIYEKFGMDVELSVGISNNTNTYIKEYDGLTLTEGFADPVYITDKEKQISDIKNARVYHFVDPIDTMEMISYFEAIIKHNIYDQIEEEEAPIPTVITCPKLSRDMSASLKLLANQLYQIDQNDLTAQKPPILIITDVIGSDEAVMDDVANLCGCKSIRKYIDPNMLKKDQEAGNAPTVDNVFEFYGECEEVVADVKKTKFINPKHMHVYNEDGSVEDDPVYTGMVNFLEEEIKNAQETDGTIKEISLYKKRLSALKSNMVEFLVGGITIAERDSYKDLVEDAIKNCKSASAYGVGYAANWEALYAVKYLNESDNDFDELESAILDAIHISYYEIQEILYSTVESDIDTVDYCISISLNKNYGPFNISDGSIEGKQPEGNVKCSIMLDINILDTLSKIISLMVTCNQCLLQASQLNNY